MTSFLKLATAQKSRAKLTQTRRWATFLAECRGNTRSRGSPPEMLLPSSPVSSTRKSWLPTNSCEPRKLYITSTNSLSAKSSSIYEKDLYCNLFHLHFNDIYSYTFKRHALLGVFRYDLRIDAYVHAWYTLEDQFLKIAK